MAWTPNRDGTLTCGLHGKTWRPGEPACPTCSDAPVEVTVDQPGPLEAHQLDALAAGLPTRIQAEAELYRERKLLEATAVTIEGYAAEAIADCDRKTAAALYSAAVRYRVEAGKHLRTAIGLVTHRTRAAEAERFDRLFMNGAARSALPGAVDGGGN